MAIRNARPRLAKRVVLALTMLSFCSPSWAAKSSTYNIGGSIGIGGTGLKKVVPVDGVETNVARSESPGVFSLFIDKLYSDSWSFSFEHSRGFRFGPFSSGVSFTEVTSRWYPFSPVMHLTNSAEEKSFLFVKRYSPFVGGGLGIAAGSISREGDVISQVDASGIVMSFRGGFDYSMSPDFAIRPEITYATSIMATGTYPSILSKFAITCGFVFPF